MTNYEVTIDGIGKNPLVCIIKAKSAGYAGRLARDKYGDWITITSTREIELQQKPLPRARRRQAQQPNSQQPRSLRDRQDKELKLPTWKTRFTEEAKKEELEKASRREAIAQALDRKRDEATFK